MYTENHKNHKKISQEIYEGDVMDMFGFCIGNSRGYLTEFYGERVKGGVNRGVEEGMWWPLLC